jgi:hypothetical protein
MPVTGMVTEKGTGIIYCQIGKRDPPNDVCEQISPFASGDRNFVEMSRGWNADENDTAVLAGRCTFNSADHVSPIEFLALFHSQTSGFGHPRTAAIPHFSCSEPPFSACPCGLIPCVHNKGCTERLIRD